MTLWFDSPLWKPKKSLKCTYENFVGTVNKTFRFIIICSTLRKMHKSKWSSVTVMRLRQCGNRVLDSFASFLSCVLLWSICFTDKFLVPLYIKSHHPFPNMLLTWCLQWLRHAFWKIVSHIYFSIKQIFSNFQGLIMSFLWILVFAKSVFWSNYIPQNMPEYRFSLIHTFLYKDRKCRLEKSCTAGYFRECFF